MRRHSPREPFAVYPVWRRDRDTPQLLYLTSPDTFSDTPDGVAVERELKREARKGNKLAAEFLVNLFDYTDPTNTFSWEVAQ